MISSSIMAGPSREKGERGTDSDLLLVSCPISRKTGVVLNSRVSGMITSRVPCGSIVISGIAFLLPAPFGARVSITILALEGLAVVDQGLKLSQDE